MEKNINSFLTIFSFSLFTTNVVLNKTPFLQCGSEMFSSSLHSWKPLAGIKLPGIICEIESSLIYFFFNFLFFFIFPLWNLLLIKFFDSKVSAKNFQSYSWFFDKMLMYSEPWQISKMEHLRWSNSYYL